jgi:hypothetical protein
MWFDNFGVNFFNFFSTVNRSGGLGCTVLWFTNLKNVICDCLNNGWYAPVHHRLIFLNWYFNFSPWPIDLCKFRSNYNSHFRKVTVWVFIPTDKAW